MALLSTHWIALPSMYKALGSALTTERKSGRGVETHYIQNTIVFEKWV